MTARKTWTAVTACVGALALGGVAFGAAEGNDPTGDASPPAEDIVSYTLNRDGSSFFVTVTFAGAATAADMTDVDATFGTGGANCTEDVHLSGKRGGDGDSSLTYTSTGGTPAADKGSSVLLDGGKTINLVATAKSEFAAVPTCAKVRIGANGDVGGPALLNGDPLPLPTATATPTPTATPKPTKPKPKKCANKKYKRKHKKQCRRKKH